MRSQHETGHGRSGEDWPAAIEVQGLKTLVDLGIGLVAEGAVIGEGHLEGREIPRIDRGRKEPKSSVGEQCAP